MLDGFNDGWLTFDADGGEPLLGTIMVDSVIAELVDRTDPDQGMIEPVTLSARS